MATHSYETIASSPTQSEPAALLRRTLFANVAVSTLSGLALIAGAAPLADLMDITSWAPLAVLGAGILAFAYGVYRVATETPISRFKATVIAELDALWVVASIVVLATDAFNLSTEGRWLVLIAADIVGMLAIAEFIGVRRLGK